MEFTGRRDVISTRNFHTRRDIYIYYKGSISLVYSHGRIYYKSNSIQDDFSLFELFFALIKPYVTYTGILVVFGDGFTYTVHLPRI